MDYLINEDQESQNHKYHLSERGLHEKKSNLFNVFVIEDDEDDLMFSKRALSVCTRVDEIHCFYNPEDIFTKMEECGYFKDDYSIYQDNPIILMDIHMPRTSGIEMLEQLKSHPVTDEIPVVLISNDISGKKIQDAYRLRAHSYLGKPLNLKKFNIILDDIYTQQGTSKLQSN